MSMLLLAALLAAAPEPARPWPEVLGAARSHVVRPGDSLVELARAYDLGFNEIAAANPRLDPWIPDVAATAVIPTAFVVPAAAAPGRLVVNLSEMRLYFFPAQGGPVTFPVGVAVEPRATPLGELEVVEKTVLPTWYPTPAIRSEDPELPAVVPPGPENPLGSHALRLSKRTILIHGTNKPFGIGRKVTHGCVRLYPEDIPHLFRLVGIGTKVAMVREPVKVGVRDGRVFVEVHEDDAMAGDAAALAGRLLGDRGLADRVDASRLAAALRARTGVPVDVSAAPIVERAIERAAPERRAARPAVEATSLRH
jgi:L,D-transpeptidase ErfK/SrfK